MFDEQGITLEFDIDSIPALGRKKKEDVRECYSSAVREGIMTRNEARKIIGLETYRRCR